MVYPNSLKVILPGGAYASRRFVDWLMEPDIRRVQNLIDGARIDGARRDEEHGLNVNPLERPLSLQAMVSDESLTVDRIFEYLDDGHISSPEIHVIKDLLERPGIETLVQQRLNEFLSVKIDPMSPAQAWERQDLSDNCVPTLVSMIANQHGKFNTETYATLQGMIDEYRHVPFCVEVEGIVCCDPHSSLIGTPIEDVAGLFEANHIPVQMMKLKALSDLDALLLTGRSVCIVVDARHLWSEIFPDRISPDGDPLGHMIQIVAKTPGGDYIALDSGHDLGREIVYSGEKVLAAWQIGEFRTIVTEDTVPGWQENTEATQTVEPTETEDASVGADMADLSLMMHSSESFGIGEASDVEMEAAVLMNASDEEFAIFELDPQPPVVPDVHMTAPETLNTAETDGGADSGMF